MINFLERPEASGYYQDLKNFFGKEPTIDEVAGYHFGKLVEKGVAKPLSGEDFKCASKDFRACYTGGFGIKNSLIALALAERRN